MNALETCEALGVNATELHNLWSSAKEDKRVVRCFSFGNFRVLCFLMDFFTEKHDNRHHPISIYSYLHLLPWHLPPQVKIAHGTFCGELIHNDRTVYCLNGFFPYLREKMLSSSNDIKYLVVEWDSSKLSWTRFAADVIGYQNPAEAFENSVRGKLYEQWESLGLSKLPDHENNGVHASTSPLEGLLEKRNWLG